MLSALPAFVPTSAQPPLHSFFSNWRYTCGLLPCPWYSTSSHTTLSFTMSSVFSFDNWDSLLEVTPPALTSSASSNPSPSIGLAGRAPLSTSSSSVSTTSGEFQPFLAVGAAVAGGVVEKFFLCFSRREGRSIA